MTEHNLEHADDRKVLRGFERRNGGRLMSGLLLAGIGGFWLMTNLTDNAVLIADNPGRVVFPALVILLGIANLFAKRDS